MDIEEPLLEHQRCHTDFLFKHLFFPSCEFNQIDLGGECLSDWHCLHTIQFCKIQTHPNKACKWSKMIKLMDLLSFVSFTVVTVLKCSWTNSFPPTPQLHFLLQITQVQSRYQEVNPLDMYPKKQHAYCW